MAVNPGCGRLGDRALGFGIQRLRRNDGSLRGIIDVLQFLSKCAQAAGDHGSGGLGCARELGGDICQGAAFQVSHPHGDCLSGRKLVDRKLQPLVGLGPGGRHAG